MNMYESPCAARVPDACAGGRVRTEFLHPPSRLLSHLNTFARAHPGVWHDIDAFRSLRRTRVTQWPEWCFLPLGGAHAILGSGDSHPLIGHKIALLAALSAWRLTQGIYRFDEQILTSLWDTPIEGKLPVDILYRLPEWCVYVETPGKRIFSKVLHGFYVHLEWNSSDGHAELRVLFDMDSGLNPFPIHLVADGLQVSIEHTLMELRRQTSRRGLNDGRFGGDADFLASEIAPLLSLTVYLCTATAEYRATDGSGSQPSRPAPKRSKGRERYFPATRPTVWETGYRMGAALRSVWRESGEYKGGNHASPRPHIRRAHWHGFWVGSKRRPSERRMDVRWMPPLPVGVKRIEDLVPVIRQVQ